MFLFHFTEDEITAPGDLCDVFKHILSLDVSLENHRITEAARDLQAQRAGDSAGPPRPRWETTWPLVFPTFPGMVTPAVPWAGCARADPSFRAGLFPTSAQPGAVPLLCPSAPDLTWLPLLPGERGEPLQAA